MVQQPKSEIVIVDSWVDQTLWELLTNVPSGIGIRVLTSTMKGDFRLEAGKGAKAAWGYQLGSAERTPIIIDLLRSMEFNVASRSLYQMPEQKAFVVSKLKRPQIINAALTI